MLGKYSVRFLWMVGGKRAWQGSTVCACSVPTKVTQPLHLNDDDSSQFFAAEITQTLVHSFYIRTYTSLCYDTLNTFEVH